MNISCTICSDLLNQVDKLYVTQCGHVFHYLCLMKWINRSKSCPQCRSKVTNNHMFPIYPSLSDNDTVVTRLQSQLENIRFQFNQLKASQKLRNEKMANAELQLKKNLNILQDTEKKLEAKQAEMGDLTGKLQFAITQNGDVQKLKEENEILKKNLQTVNGASECTMDRLRDMEAELSTEKICTAALKARIARLEGQIVEFHHNKECVNNKRKAADGPQAGDPSECLKHRRVSGAESANNNVIVAYHNGPRDCRFIITMSPLGVYEATYFGDTSDAAEHAPNL